MKTFCFYLIYYLTNHVVNRVPWHAFRLLWYRTALKMRIDNGAHLFAGLVLMGNCINRIHIGEMSAVNPDCLLNASDAIEIGRHVVLAHRVSLHTADHDINSPDFRMRTAPIRIEDGAWIASHAIILKGVTIGKGAVVAAGAVVVKSVAPWEVVAGNPARVVGHRRETEIQFSQSAHPLFM
ncbi:MAG: DapH/DapD/GlmU-related protein [Verrucomicrobiae bacterium]|nr:DapH/DapD/GlmU-related protein [Verrucomicrobiae bacterium]